MGISDDIKPKKVHHYVEHSLIHHKNGSRHKKSEESDEDEKLLNDFYHNDPEKLEQLEDDFFDEKEHQRAREIPAEHRHRPVKRYIILLLIVALGALVIVQNFDIIKSYFLGTPSQKTTHETISEESYAGEPTTTEQSATPTITTTTTEEPAATPAATSTTFSIEVLNGNGITGSADKIKSTLIAAGLTVEKVTNAKSFSYQKTYIYYKTGKEAEANQVKTVLTSRDCILEVSDTVAKDYDVVVVVGKN